MKALKVSLFLISQALIINGQMLPGFKLSDFHNEQQLVIENVPPGTRILINAPAEGFGKDDRVLLILFALPNGNSIEQTFGKITTENDDWHFNIQHIGAQTRFLRNTIPNRTIVVAYLENNKKSWPLWKSENDEYKNDILSITDNVKSIFKQWNPELVLNGHSGGGRFIFSYLDAVNEIPDEVKRIAFLDSNYGFEYDPYGTKIATWLNSGKDKFLCTLAYNDSVVIYDGKPLVSPTGGTWYRSKMMLGYLSDSFRFKKDENDSLIWYKSRKNRIEIILKKNPEGKIYHTTQVEFNGFIHSILSGTPYELKGYEYYGERSYSEFISESVNIPIRRLNIESRTSNSEQGSEFMNRVEPLSLDEREEEIFNAISTGNIPGFLRNTIRIDTEAADANGVNHTISYDVMPDYLSIGSDDDFCRIPMNPHTAQRIADLFGASMITAKISDQIYESAEVKLDPFFYAPVGNANELVSKLRLHNEQIEKQFAEAGGKRGELTAGIKKDIILTERISDLPNKVVLYGWHKLDGRPIQPVYSGHVSWYVDYSHGIRLINNQVLIDGKTELITEILKDPVLFKLFSNEEKPMVKTDYTRKMLP